MKRIIFFIAIWIGVCFYGIGQISKNVTTKQSDLNIEKTDEYSKISLNKVFYATDIAGQPELPRYRAIVSRGKFRICHTIQSCGSGAENRKIYAIKHKKRLVNTKNNRYL